MDQIKTFLAAVKQHHFWILCGLASVTGLVILMAASRKLLTEYDSKKSQISTAEHKLDPYTPGSEHPNEKWIEIVNAKVKGYQKKVFDAWGRLYQQQKSKIFIWPKELGPEFVEAFKIDPAPVSRNKMAELSEYYQTYITATALPAMAKIINAKWIGRGDGDAAAPQQFLGGRTRNGLPRAVEPNQSAETYTVVWDAADQQRMYDLYAWRAPPTEMEIRFAQEEMWVLRALFDSIAQANNGAQIPSDAVVRQIQEVSLGFDAAGKTPLGEGANRIVRMRPAAGIVPPGGAPVTSGQLDPSAPPMMDIQRPGRPRPGGPDPSGPRGRDRRLPPGSLGPAPPPGATDAPGGAAESSDPRNGHYVNSKGKPIAGSELATTPEYRLMAFRLVLVCDESRFQTVLAELANSVMPLEVREVRINTSSENANDRGPRHDPGRPRGFAGNQGDAGSVMHDATIEIFGMAYLVNPPDPKKVGLSETPAEGNATGSAAATTGTATTATTGTASAPGVTPADTATPATTGTEPSGNGATAAPAAPPATTSTTDAATTPPSNDKSGAAPAPDAAQDKSASGAATGDAATKKADAAATDAATPPK